MKNRLKQAKLSTTYVLMLYMMPFKITGLGQAFQTTSRAYDSMGAVSARTCKFFAFDF